MAKRDYYEVLGVSQDGLRRRNQKGLPQAGHEVPPDRNQGDKAKEAEEQFKEVEEAYEMLSDSQKRAAYDQYGHAGVDPNMRGGPGGAEGFGGFAEAFGDIFGDMFGGQRGGGARGGARRHRGNDLSYTMEITLEEAAKGKASRIRIPSWDTCDTCHGSGAKPGTQPKTCTTCNGHGHGADAPGSSACSKPAALPRHGQDHSRALHQPATARARSRGRRRWKSNIPAGIDDGMRIRCAGNGEPGIQRRPTGRTCTSKSASRPHDIFERDGDDLHCQVPVSFITAAPGRRDRSAHAGGQGCDRHPRRHAERASSSACAARASRACAPATPATCTATSWSKTPVKLTEYQRKLLVSWTKSLKKGGSKHSQRRKLDRPAQALLQLIGIPTRCPPGMRRGGFFYSPRKDCDTDIKKGAATAYPQ